jgi:hypothetical protein
MPFAVASRVVSPADLAMMSPELSANAMVESAVLSTGVIPAMT